MAFDLTNGTSLSEIEYKRFLDQGIPATICLSFLCIIGTIGNMHMILIFKLSPVMAKYSIRVFIIWLSLTDLIACLFCMPLEIYNIKYSYTTSTSGCKFFIFLFHVIALASSGFWTTIAVEGYRIIVKKEPILFLNSQRSNNVISAVLVGVFVVLSIPVVIVSGPNEIQTMIPGITGKDCTVLSQNLNIHNAAIYYIIILSTFSSVFAVVCIVSYARILWDICNGIKIRKSLRGKPNSSFNSQTHIRFGNTHVNSSIQNEEIQTIHVPAKMGYRTNASQKNENALRLTVSLQVQATTVSYIAYMLMAYNFTNGTHTNLRDIEHQEFLDKDIPATLFLIFLSVIGLVCVVMCIVSYGRILHAICTRKEWRKSIRKKSVPASNSTSDIRSGTTQVTSTIHREAVKLNKLQTGTSDRANQKPTRSSHNLGNAIRLTISLRIATGLVCVVMCIFSYGKILHDICTRKRMEKSIRKKSVSSLNSTLNIRSGTTQLISTIQNEAVKLNELQTETCDRANRKSTRPSRLGNAIRLNISLMIATAVCPT
ncbi:unnamed protein product [Mytilus coruscus]|uniref:G-protein coupled receptors family 1 profile domain-containing protein n=1 Tax=Mytilus coruscus TaxID=42192 RepID=A0A6J8DNF1_MYTCO|nr:unnamed protein product [Mytilus coruscus]